MKYLNKPLRSTVEKVLWRVVTSTLCTCIPWGMMCVTDMLFMHLAYIEYRFSLHLILHTGLLVNILLFTRDSDLQLFFLHVVSICGLPLAGQSYAILIV